MISIWALISIIVLFIFPEGDRPHLWSGAPMQDHREARAGRVIPRRLWHWLGLACFPVFTNAQTLSLQPAPQITLFAQHAGYAKTAATVGDAVGPAASARPALEVAFEAADEDARLLGKQIASLVHLLPGDGEGRSRFGMHYPGISDGWFDGAAIAAVRERIGDRNFTVDALRSVRQTSADRYSDEETAFLEAQPAWLLAPPRTLRNAFDAVIGAAIERNLLDGLNGAPHTVRGRFRRPARLTLPTLDGTWVPPDDICGPYVKGSETTLINGLMSSNDLWSLGIRDLVAANDAVAGLKRECDEANRRLADVQALAVALRAYAKDPTHSDDAVRAAIGKFPLFGVSNVTSTISRVRQELSGPAANWAAVQLAQGDRPLFSYRGTYLELGEIPPIIDYSGKGNYTVGRGTVRPERLPTKRQFFDRDGTLQDVETSLRDIEMAYWSEVDQSASLVSDAYSAAQLQALNTVLVQRRNWARNLTYQRLENEIDRLATMRAALLASTTDGRIFTPEPATVAGGWLVKGQPFHAGDVMATVVPALIKRATFKYRLSAPDGMSPGSQWTVRLKGSGPLPVGGSTRAKLAAAIGKSPDNLLSALHGALLESRTFYLRIGRADSNGSWLSSGGTFTGWIEDRGPSLVDMDVLLPGATPDRAAWLAALDKAGLLFHRNGHAWLYLERGILNDELTYDLASVTVLKLRP